MDSRLKKQKSQFKHYHENSWMYFNFEYLIYVRFTSLILLSKLLITILYASPQPQYHRTHSTNKCRLWNTKPHFIDVLQFVVLVGCTNGNKENSVRVHAYYKPIDNLTLRVAYCVVFTVNNGNDKLRERRNELRYIPYVPRTFFFVHDELPCFTTLY